jgi:hypothetical protein
VVVPDVAGLLELVVGVVLDGLVEVAPAPLPGAAPVEPALLPGVALVPPGVVLGVVVGSVVIGVGASGRGFESADATMSLSCVGLASVLFRSLYTKASASMNAFLSAGAVLTAAARAKASICRSRA